MEKSISTSKRQRSHSGCTRCKRRRQKCDEGKPCGRCMKARVACDYSVNLRWGGRSFDRSRFGDCLKAGGMKIIGDIHQGFIYTASAASHHVLAPVPTIFQDIPSLSSDEKRLLLHFTSKASRITCCNPHVQLELCALIVPMAFESPALMNATLAWAALHNVASYGNIPGQTPSESRQTISRFKSRSIESLRREIQASTSFNSLLATIRTLCQCEIHSGSDQLSTWRVHIKGAKALMSTIESSHTTSSSPRLLCRWYASLDSLALLSASNSPIENGDGKDGFGNLGNAQVYLDDYNGYATDLSYILGRIGNAIAFQKGREQFSQTNEVKSEADHFEAAVCKIMERDNFAAPNFYPGVLEKLSPQAIQEYAWCNQAYQHTALLHIRRRLRKLPSQTPEIQDSVKTIINCVRSIAPAHGLSPTIVLTTPLFTAGCEALGQDREAIKELLNQLYDLLRIRNIKLALEALKRYWETCGPDDDIETLLRKSSSEVVVHANQSIAITGGQNWDFIPY